MGGTGFPTLMFLDAEGRKLMKYSGPRTSSGFADSLTKIEDFLALGKKAEAGDEKAATEYFIAQLELEWLSLEDARKKVETLTKVSSKQKKQIAQLLVDTEVRELAKKAGDDLDGRIEAGKHFAEMFKEKRVPGSQAQLTAYWTIMADYAESARDKKLFKKIVKEFEDTVKSGSYSRKTLKSLEQRLADFPKK